MLTEILKNAKIAESDAKLVDAGVSAMAVSLFMGQVNGLIKFPGGPFTVGEIESKLVICVEAFVQKLVELSFNKG